MDTSFSFNYSNFEMGLKKQEEEEEEENCFFNSTALIIPKKLVPDSILQIYSQKKMKEKVTIKKDRINKKAPQEQDKDGKFLCKTCRAPFSSYHDAKNHVLPHKTWEELKGVTQYHERCEECGKIFFNKKVYPVHCDMHNGAYKVECLICKKTFTNKDTLKIHSSVHLGKEEKEKVKTSWMYNCYFCNNKFQKFSIMSIHMCIRTKEKPFKCLTCKKNALLKVT
jgi:hypothetical protein